jgi:hypothetical protein
MLNRNKDFNNSESNSESDFKTDSSYSSSSDEISDIEKDEYSLPARYKYYIEQIERTNEI